MFSLAKKETGVLYVKGQMYYTSLHALTMTSIALFILVVVIIAKAKSEREEEM